MHDLEAANINLVGSEPLSGVCSIDQFHVLGPFGGRRTMTAMPPALRVKP
jgi:hypothetical protein